MTALTREERVANCVSSLTSKPDFPAFSQHIQKVLAAVDDNESTVNELTGLIMRDYSLSLKLLRAANFYNLSGRKILSISHAVIMIGTEGVRNLASSLLIFEHFYKKPAGVRELMMLSMLSANHVREIATRIPALRPEEAYLSGMVRNLGEILIGYYLPGPYARVLQRMAERKQTASAAALEILQFTFEDIGEAVIRYWGMPERVAACQHPQSVSIASRASPDSLLHQAVSLGHDITTAVYRMDPKAGADRLKLCLRGQNAWMPMGRKEIEEILKVGITDTQESFAAMGIPLDQLRLEAQTRTAVAALEEAGSGEATEQFDAGPPDVVTLEQLTKEVCLLLDSSSEIDLNALILKVLEAIYRGAAFDRVIFAFLNEEGTAIEGRIGIGDNVDALVEKFRFRMSLSGGPVSLALLSKRTVIGDTQRDEANRIGRLFGCSYLCLYPVVVARQVVGCIFGESQESRLALTSGELQTLEELRDSLESAIARLRRRPALGTKSAARP